MSESGPMSDNAVDPFVPVGQPDGHAQIDGAAKLFFRDLACSLLNIFLQMPSVSRDKLGL